MGNLLSQSTMAIRTVTTTHKWKIDSVIQQISVLEKDGSISSGVFSLNGKSKAQFSIKLVRNRVGKIDVCLVRMSSGNKEMKLSVKHWFENTGGTVAKSYGKNFTFNNSSNMGVFANCYSVDEMKSYARNDTLFLYCEIQRKESINEFDEDGSEDDKKELEMRTEFGQKLLDLHSDGHFDLTIQAGGKQFKAFKFALMAYSPYFRRMLSCPNSIEAKTSFIKMENIKPEVIEALIHWIYHANVHNIEKIAVELYQAADKYEIAPLKEKCVKAIGNSLSTENIVPRLILTYKFHEESLKQHILNFIRGDYKKVASLMSSEEWLKFVCENSEEAKKIGEDIIG